MSSETVHRKLTDSDYAKMRWESDNNYTIREIAATHGVSTKFVNRVLHATVQFDISGNVHFAMGNDYQAALSTTQAIGSSFNCTTGCGRYFENQASFDFHVGFYTESGAHSLTCSTVMPGVSR